MRKRPFTTAVSRPLDSRVPIVLSLAALVLIVLFWSIGLAYGATSESEPRTSEQVAPMGPGETGESTEVESVTMSIDLEEGGVIDVDAPTTDVKIETWDGDEVLVIVEKTKRASRGGQKSAPAEPINIQVTRSGKDVKIHSTGTEDWSKSGMNISFRIVLPERFKERIEPVQTGDTMARLTSTLWRVFQRGALKWIVR